jgi:hypothetical protein
MTMKYHFPAVALLLIALFACKNNDKAFMVSNETAMDMVDKAIVLNRHEVNAYLADTSSGKKVLVKDEQGNLLVTQNDDLDGDGRWDEMAFLCNLKKGEKKKVFFVLVDTLPFFKARTNIRFGSMIKPFDDITTDVRMKTNDTKYTAPVYQMEGPAWENDQVAFRNYYDFRNGIDIFGKLTDAMVMDSVGVNGRQYHTLADWGMDILKVGNSLGAGAIAIAIGDSVYRVGPCEEGKYRLITEGPVRAILELTYKNAIAGDRLYQIKHQISIYAGDHAYRSKVWVDGVKGDESLVTGIVNLHNVPADTLTVHDKKIIYSLGNQGFSGELLGLGIIFPAAEFMAYQEAPPSGRPVISTHMVFLRLQNNVPVVYTFATAWENRETGIKDKGYFEEMLKTEAIK